MYTIHYTLYTIHYTLYREYQHESEVNWAALDREFNYFATSSSK